MQKESNVPVLGIVEVTISDPSWVDEYIENVTPMLQKYGARYITRTQSIEMIEGAEQSKPQVLVVSEFPSREIAHQFYNSIEYEPYKLSRQKGAECRFLLVEQEQGTSA